MTSFRKGLNFITNRILYKDGEMSNFMKFSLIIPVAPTRNPEIIRSIENLDYPKKEFEVIVEKGRGASENRNKGIKNAKGEILIFLDDDATIENDYLKKVEDFFEKYTSVDIVGGPQITPKDDRFFAKICGIALTSHFGAFKVRKRYESCRVDLDADETSITSANLCVRKNVFEKIEGFDTSLYPGEDPEFISRAKKNGLRVASSPDIIVSHKRRANFSLFCKQIFHYGFVRPQKNKISGKTPLFFTVPMLFLVYLLILPSLVILHGLFIAPLLAYIFLAIVFSLYDSLRSRRILPFFILPFIYFFTHISYGLGMLGGYFKR